MAVESAADRAAFVNADEFGAAATFTPSGGGAAVSLNVALSRPTDRMPGRAGFEAAAYTALARQDDLASSPRGGTLVIGAQTFKVSRAGQDVVAGFWDMDLELQS